MDLGKIAYEDPDITAARAEALDIQREWAERDAREHARLRLELWRPVRIDVDETVRTRTESAGLGELRCDVVVRVRIPGWLAEAWLAVKLRATGRL